ncbi:Fibronectin type III domain protein [Fimbriimonas ginsengisoli Gsoil 348]|uniref:Fibronectin type III domain protein n=1 Tax=Fimbriimonas ginsengisoli Gsoil 348 TaxID=661478 RepID=A0A068NKY0_FIMGI|nr:Fibronectin type III domain protein [Fimbriimonas ginsengisoli Gsoil 348]
MAATRDGTTLLIREGRTISKLNPVNLTPEAFLALSEEPVDMALSSDGMKAGVYLASGIVHILDVATLTTKLTIDIGPPNEGVDTPVVDSLSADGKRVSRFMADGEYREWDADTGKPIRQMRVPGIRRGSGILDSPDGKYVVLLGSEAKDGSHVGVLYGPNGRLQSIGTSGVIAFSVNSDLLWYRAPDGGLIALEMATGKKKHLVVGESNISALTTSGDRRVVVNDGGSDDGRIGGPSEIVGIGRNSVHIGYVPDLLPVVTWWKGHIVAGGRGGRILIIDADSGSPEAELKGHQAVVLQCIPFGERLVTRDISGKLCLWDWPSLGYAN